MDDYGFDTLQLHAGWRADPATGAHAIPLYQTNAYLFENAADAAAQFSMDKDGYIYSRIANPTVEALEKRLCALERGRDTVCFASGMAAVLAAVQNLADSGSEIIALSTLYGGSYTLLFTHFETRYGVKAHRIDPEDLAGLEAAINGKTRAVYFEAIGNPAANIPDISGIVAIAHRHGLPVVCDTTFATPYLFDARAAGIDFTVQSLTKYVCGNGTALGGSVTDLGNFDFRGNPRFAAFNAPDEAYHGLVYADDPVSPYAARLRTGFLRDTGAMLAPFSAYLILLGCQTLSLRMQRHCENADIVARHLKEHGAVAYVRYARLPESPYHARAMQYFPKGAGSIFTFGVRGGLEAGRRFIDALKLFSLVANVGDSRSLVAHPASTTHSQMGEEALLAAGIRADMIRLSVGIEDAKDLIADLDAALEESQHAG